MDAVLNNGTQHHPDALFIIGDEFDEVKALVNELFSALVSEFILALATRPVGYCR